MKLLINNRQPNLIAPYVPPGIYAGATVDKYGYIIFNWKKDSKKDIIALTTTSSGEYTQDGVRYVYGFTYRSGVSGRSKKLFRNYIKQLGADFSLLNPDPDQDVQEFIERAVYQFDAVYDINSFGATVRVESNHKNNIVGVMSGIISDICENSKQITFTMIKQMYKNVEFDSEKAYQLLLDAGKTSQEAHAAVKDVVNMFEDLKQSGQLFEMKRFTPRELRGGFKNFLKFKTLEQKHTYELLQGVDVRIYDDFLTSGATVQEIVRYLRSIHDKNRLTVFVLIKQ